jgi:Zn-finger nucleic acid-binding protein
MKCPQCSAQTRPVNVKSIKLDRCPECGGTWFEKGELRLLKDRERHEDYRWIDVDLWKDAEQFVSGEQRGRACPVDAKPLLTVHYGDSPVHVDICEHCHGIYLEKGAYRAILEHLEQQVNTGDVGDYLGDLKDEFVEIFTGGEGPLAEARDFAKVLHLLELRFVVQHLNLAAALRAAARGIPGA